MTPRRLKSVHLIAAVAVSGLILIAWTQPWFTVTLVPDQVGGAVILIDGSIAAGGLAALGLAGLALVGALAIAGPVFRIVLGVLEALIGITVLLSAVPAIIDPVSASSPAVTSATGVSGAESVSRLVESVSFTPWPWIAVALGAASVSLGVLVVVTGRRWPGSSRKYSAVRLEDAAGEQDAAAEPDPIGDWDALSDGSDPTSR